MQASVQSVEPQQSGAYLSATTTRLSIAINYRIMDPPEQSLTLLRHAVACAWAVMSHNHPKSAVTIYVWAHIRSGISRDEACNFGFIRVCIYGDFTVTVPAMAVLYTPPVQAWTQRVLSLDLDLGDKEQEQLDHQAYVPH